MTRIRRLIPIILAALLTLATAAAAYADAYWERLAH
jgi:hypothetical protein